VFEIFVRTHFSSAHYLRNYPGKCEFLHGHNWEVEAAVKTEKLDAIDVGLDFKEFKKALFVIMEELDHKNLNEHPAFANCNPSSEKLAQYIFGRLKEELQTNPNVSVSRVLIMETPGCGVVYTE